MPWANVAISRHESTNARNEPGSVDQNSLSAPRGILLGVFGGLAVTLLVFSFVLWTISGRVVEWMHGAEKVTS